MLTALLLLAAPVRTIVVRPGSGVPTIAAALALAHRGDTITVTAGTYRVGNLVVSVPGVVLQGEGWPVLDGGGVDEILILTANDITVRRFVLRGAGVSMTRDQAAVRAVRIEGYGSSRTGSKGASS